jgi:TPR repeat protein
MRWLDRLARQEPCRAPRNIGRSDANVPAQMAAAYEAACRNDHATALGIWGPLAHAGVARAQNNVGACFAEGLGVDRDPALALRWLTLAAEAGDPVGQRNLAALYFKGQDFRGQDFKSHGVEQDYARAGELYRAAAEQGDGLAQDMLSWMQLEGECIPRDVDEARRWAQAAADQGIAAAMTRVGMLYHNALGVDRDASEAARWWRRGAEHGDADGQAMLGAALALGSGVPRDPVAALAWLLRAQSGGSALAGPFLGSARAALDADGIAEAQRLAATPLPEPTS